MQPVEEEVPARDRLVKALASTPETITVLDLSVKAKTAEKFVESDISKVQLIIY